MPTFIKEKGKTRCRRIDWNNYESIRQAGKACGFRLIALACKKRGFSFHLTYAILTDKFMSDRVFLAAQRNQVQS